VSAVAAWLALGLTVTTLVTGAAAGSPEPFTALGLVRLDGAIRAPEFTLADLDGRPVGIAATPAATVLMFWSTW
jgi:hypothetical protein